MDLFDPVIFDVLSDYLDRKDGANLLRTFGYHDEIIYRIYFGKYWFDQQELPLKFLKYCKMLIYVGENLLESEKINNNDFTLTFSKPLECKTGGVFLSVIFPKNLTHLILHQEYGPSLNLPDTLTHLTLGYHYNQSLNFPDNLTHLTLGWDYNQPLNLPPNLQSIKLYNHQSHLIDGFKGEIIYRK